MRTALGALIMLLLVSACDSPPASDGIEVVATTSIWADVAGEVLGEEGTVSTLIPRGSDAHDFQPSAAQIARVHRADLVIANGLGLEEGIHNVLEAAIDDGVNVLELAPELDPIPLPNRDDVDHGDLDPHVWFDPRRAAHAARLIAERLSVIDPTVDWMGRAADYSARLETADEAIASILDPIPPASRMLVTNHEALGYFADRYGFEVVGVVIPGGSTLAVPSSAQLAGLTAAIRELGVPAIFTETSHPQALAEAVAAEVGFDVEIVELYVETLGDPGTEEGTLIGILTENARRIAAGLT